MINENYKKRLQKLAGIQENASIGQGGELKNFSPHVGYIPGDKEFIYSITYEELDPSEGGEEENDDWTDSGFEVENTTSRLGFIIEIAKSNGISEPSSSQPSSGMWWSSNDPEQSRDFFERGIQKFYSLHIKNLDGTPLSKEESGFITKLLKSRGASWEDWDNTVKPEWKGLEEIAGIDEISSINSDGELEGFDFNDEVEIMGPPFIPITIPITNKDEINMFAQVINQGIDSSLEGFTKSKFGVKHTSLGKRIVLNFHKDELPTLIRRLEELGSEESLTWAEDLRGQNKFGRNI